MTARESYSAFGILFFISPVLLRFLLQIPDAYDTNRSNVPEFPNECAALFLARRNEFCGAR